MTQNSLNQSFLSILTSVELVSEIKLSASFYLFAYLYLCSTIFWEWLNIFFRNFEYGPLRHWWGSHKHKNSHLSPTLGKGAFWVIFAHFCRVFLHSLFSWERFNILSWNLKKCFWCHYATKNHSVALSAGSHFGLFLGSFCFMFQYFLRTIQYFLMKFYTDVLGIL